MKLVIASDKSGFNLKEAVKAHLNTLGHEVADVGTQDPENPVKFMYAAANAARALQNGEADRGIVICGSGGGVGLVANKFKGVYCVMAESEWAARKARFVNNANMLAMGGNVIAPPMGIDMVNAFLNTEFHQGANEDLANLLEELYRDVQELEEELF